MRTWRINDYAVLYLLWLNGYHCERIQFAGPAGDTWHTTDFPIDLNGRVELPGGFVIEAIHGVELRATRKEQSKR